MLKVKLFAALLMAAGTLATPALARGSFVGSNKAAYAYARTATTDTTRDCFRAPRVGAFATQPWIHEAPCEPNAGF
jgi:hypothetical protein